MQWFDNEGEVIVLNDGTSPIIDHFSYFSDRNNDDNTWQRLPDGGGKWIFALSSLGSTNIGKAGKPKTPLLLRLSSPLPPSTSPILSRDNSNNSSSYTPDTQANGTHGNGGEIKIIFIDVEQGDSILVICPIMTHC